MISVELLIIAIHYFRLISMPININCKEVTMIILKNVLSINEKKSYMKNTCKNLRISKYCKFATLYFEEVQFRPSRKPVLWVTSRLWNGGTWIVCVWGFKAVGSPLTAAQWPQLSNDLIEQTLRLRFEIRTSTETLCRDPNFVFR